MQRFHRTLGLAAAVAMGIGAGHATAPGQDFVPSALARQYFRVESESTRTKGGRPLLNGYVYNLSPYDVGNVRLGVEALGAGGEPVGGMTTGWVNGDIPANGGRRYFEVPLALAATDYRVTIQSYTSRVADSDHN